MKRFLLVSIITIGNIFITLAQSANAPFSEQYYHWIDRWEIKSGIQQDKFHTSFKPYQRIIIGGYLDTADSLPLLGTEKRLLKYLKIDNWEWVDKVNHESTKPILKYFYRSKSDFYHVKTEHFDLHINPIIHVEIGQDSENNINTYRNTRGIRLRGIVDGKVGFYTSLTENQIRVPKYISDWVTDYQSLPHVGFYKGFKEGGYDYFDARGYLSFNATRHINLQLGHDNFKIGNGYRSMFLSDFSPAYFFIKMETRVWKIKYTNLYTEMTANKIRGAETASGHPSKYSVFHHLSIDIGKKLNLGLFEAVMIGGATDTTDADLEIGYLNPIIFYRAIEQQNGSAHNALIGADFQWLPIKSVSLYGQLILDEFLLDNIKAGDGWWGNKFGVQLGGEWINSFGIPTLDLQAELNLARPFTYTHSNIGNSYSNYLQPLAHPLGANFNERIFIARYQPINNLFAQIKFIDANKGLDGEDQNWGGNILKDYTTREQDRNNIIGQGISQNIRLIEFTASYMIKHNLFVDAILTARSTDAPDPAFTSNTTWISGGIRWNIFNNPYHF